MWSGISYIKERRKDVMSSVPEDNELA
ncbi:hypothetical protein LNO81_13445 [Klebsiella variicola subsp. variicola]|nr:hypothetical protein [Klebsiella variicola subsp. variicola]